MLIGFAFWRAVAKVAWSLCRFSNPILDSANYFGASLISQLAYECVGGFHFVSVALTGSECFKHFEAPVNPKQARESLDGTGYESGVLRYGLV